MISEWLQRQGHDGLIVFCGGWGMDAQPFKPLSSSNYDVLICYNYGAKPEEKPDVAALAQEYRALVLVAWSMGVTYAQQNFCEVAHLFTRKIAVNGTLCPIDDQYGIPAAIFSGTLDTMSVDALERFYRRMCRPAPVYERFIRHRPQRALHDVTAELELMLDERLVFPQAAAIYDRVLISTKDLIVPTINQLRFWQGCTVEMLQAGHFPFYLWPSWDDVLVHPGVAASA